MSELPVAIEDVYAARELLAEVIEPTPMQRSRALSDLVGVDVYLKCENLQRAGSFKIRGAYTRMSRLTVEEKARGVVAASAGNHAQGVALAAKMLGISATVFMPTGAPLPKLAATRGYGATVHLHGSTLDEALVEAHAYAARTGAVLIHPESRIGGDRALVTDDSQPQPSAGAGTADDLDLGPGAQARRKLTHGVHDVGRAAGQGITPAAHLACRDVDQRRLGKGRPDVDDEHLLGVAHCRTQDWTMAATALVVVLIVAVWLVTRWLAGGMTISALPTRAFLRSWACTVHNTVASGGLVTSKVIVAVRSSMTLNPKVSAVTCSAATPMILEVAKRAIASVKAAAMIHHLRLRPRIRAMGSRSAASSSASASQSGSDSMR